MLKAFLKDSAIYGVANMTTRGVQLLLVPLYTRVLAPSDYGSVDMMGVVGAVAMSVLTLEVAQGMARAYGDHKHPEQRALYASTTLWFCVGASLVLMAVALFGAPLGRVILGPGMEGPFRVGALVLATQLVYNLFLAQLRFDLRPRLFGLVTVLYTVVSNTLAVVLVVKVRTGVIGVFCGQLVGYLACGAIAALATRHAYRLTFERERFREMVAYSAPLVMSVIGGHVAMLADRVIIDAYFGLHEVGVYGIGARVASTVGLLLSAFAAALTPLLLQSYRAPETPGHLARLYRVFLLLVLPILIGFTIYAAEIVRVLAPPAYAEAADVTPPLTLAVMFSGMAIFAPGLELARKTRGLAVIMVITGLENVALNLLLVPSMGVRGAALATMISAATGFSGYMAFSQRFYYVPHRWRRLGASSVVAVIAAAGGYTVTQAHLALGWAIVIKAGILLAACGALAAILLDARDVRILRDRISGAAGRARDEG